MLHQCTETDRLAKLEKDMGHLPDLDDPEGKGVLGICMRTQTLVLRLTRVVRWVGGLMIAVWIAQLANAVSTRVHVEPSAHAQERKQP